MDSHEKVMTIRRWIDPEERITVDFEDERDLNAEVIECESQTVTLLLETSIPALQTTPHASFKHSLDR